ncbi:MAG: IS701 family transposase [Planctomycetota bacterium]
MSEQTNEASVFDPHRWGLPGEAVNELAEHLRGIWSRYHDCFKTKTRDTSENAYVYLRGILTMETKRTFANIARRVIDVDEDGQNLQQFISDSPWSGQSVFDQIQAEIVARPELAGGMLTVDESADECAGDQKAGAGRQHLGREGKVDMGQVGVGIGYYKDGTWTLVDAELYLLECWFDEAHASLRKRWHIADDRTFKTKPQLGLAMVRWAKRQHLPFEVVGCDSVYGRSIQFRADLDAEGLVYMADVPANTQVYLSKPVTGIPETPPGKKGRPFTQWQVLSEDKPIQVRAIASRSGTVLQPLAVRHTERGVLTYECTARRVWTITKAGQVREEWLFIRLEHDGRFSYSLSNAAADTPLAQLALWRCQRYFAERIFQDAKSEAGWDELQARKYRSWIHHTALTALALWFVAEIKLDWAQTYSRDPELVHQLEVEVLPALSMANVRELLRAVMPLKQLSPEKATRLVVKHLVNRSHSTRSRLKAQRRNRDPPEI